MAIIRRKASPNIKYAYMPALSLSIFTIDKQIRMWYRNIKRSKKRRRLRRAILHRTVKNDKIITNSIEWGQNKKHKVKYTNPFN